jgi:hypothetical protein
MTRDGEERSPRWGGRESGGSTPAAPALSWNMPHALLSADSITIDYLDHTFAPPRDASARSSLLSRSEELVQLTWQEQGLNLTWELRLKLRDTEWWVEQMTVMVGEPATGRPPDRAMPAVHIDDDSARVALGSRLTGELDITATEQGATARVRVAGLGLLGFRDRGVDGRSGPVETAPTPVLPAAPPLPDDVTPTGMYVPVEQWMAFSIAQDALVSECMAVEGFDLPPLPDEAIVMMYGQFDVSAGLSVQGRRAAGTIGYHNADTEELLAAFTEAEERVPAEQRDEFHEARAGCEAESSASLGWTSDSGPMRSWGVVGDVRDEAYGDPAVIAALEAWGGCVLGAVGERAANPNELARMYAFANGEPSEGEATEHERSVAVADFDCQQQVEWETVWYTAVVERERAAMGERVGEYDQWVRDYQAMIVHAQQLLDERGIVVPSLD